LFTEGLTHVKCDRKVYDPTTMRVLHPGVWEECNSAFIEMGVGMTLRIGDVLRLSTPVVSIEGVE
jgi:hypothetical protein